MEDAVCETCRANNLKNGYIRLVVTRGEGSLGLSIRNCNDPQLIIIADTIQLYPQEFYKNGLKIITVPTRRCNPAALPPAVKSLNYLNNILAKIEAQHLGYHEAIMLNDEGYVAECTGDNIFILQKGELITPFTSGGALKGITRDTVLEIADELGISWREADITRYDAWTAEEVLDMVRLFQPACVLAAGADLDVFTPLYEKPMTAQFLASELSTDLRATSSFLTV